MNPIAQELNKVLQGTSAGALLSDMGEQMYFPKGIVAQSAEAGQKAGRYNATVGMATSKGEPICLDSIRTEFVGLRSSDIFPYAPTAGDARLRQLWKDELYRKNPGLAGKEISLPVVTAGLTHGVSIIADLFLSAGDTVLVPDMFWGNYRLIFEVRRKANIVTFPFFNADPTHGALNTAALEAALANSGERVMLIVNFPNNPTGYSPTNDEMKELARVVTAAAETGRKILVMTDDAYFGLFYEPDTCTESLFSYLAEAHENLLAVKGDAATKEELVWGFRVGFLTYAGKGLGQPQYEALIKKTMGAIRSSVSNCSKPAQTLLLRGMSSGSYQKEKAAAFTILEERYRAVRRVLAAYADNQLLKPLPFNSGYFMAFACAGSAEKLRVHLLDTYGVGTISIPGDYLRIAFSSVDVDQIEDLYRVLYQAAAEAWT